MHQTLPCLRLQAVLCVLVYVFPHSLPAALVLHLGQAQRSVELPQLASLLCVWAQRHSIRVFRCRTWQPIHSSVFLQLCRIWVLHTCPEIFSTRAWQHRLTTWTEHEPIALMRRFTNAHDGKTDICFIVSDLKLATILNQNMIPSPHPRSPDRLSLSRVSLVPPSSHL